ncbi:UNVERIFIED_CONTAM: hypothetical protein FKN15_005684 [Acipenser sinensis]
MLKEKGLKGCDHGWWKINEKLYCGSYIDHQTVFHVASPKVEIEFQCSSKLSDPPLIAEYGSYNISQPISFDLYAKYGNNRTLTLTSPKKPYYQWRLRVPSGHVVRLVILTLHGASPGNCGAHKLSAYDFLLPLQNKIIAR